MRIDESNYETFEKVNKITGTDYEIAWQDSKDFKGVIDVEGLYAMIEDLLMEIDRLKEEYEDYKQFVEDNFRQMTKEEMI